MELCAEEETAAKKREERQFKSAVNSFASALYEARPENYGCDTKMLIATDEDRAEFRKTKWMAAHTKPKVERLLNGLIGVVDKRARCSKERPAGATDAHDPIWAYKEGVYKPKYPPLLGFAWEYALRCFQPPEDYGHEHEVCATLFDLQLGSRTAPPYCHLPKNAYGEEHEIIDLAESVMRQYSHFYHMQQHLLFDVYNARFTKGELLHFYHRTNALSSFSDFLMHVRSYCGNHNSAWDPGSLVSRIRSRFAVLLGAQSTLRMLQEKVKKIKRLDRRCRMLEITPDVFSVTIDHLSTRSAIQMMRVCRTFRQPTYFYKLRERLPMVRFRPIGISADEFGNNPAPFPHARYTNAGRKQSYVATNLTIRVYLDFVKKELRDKLFHEDRTNDKVIPVHLWEESQDPCEERPSRVVEDADGKKKTVPAKKYKKEGPREQRDSVYYYKRMPIERVIKGTTHYTVRLVFADTKEPVPDASEETLELCGTIMRNCNGKLQHPPRDMKPTYNSQNRYAGSVPSGLPLPALGEYKVCALSSKHNGREFCLEAKLHYTGVYPTSLNEDGDVEVGKSKDDVVITNWYSEPFLTVPRLDRVCPAIQGMDGPLRMRVAQKRAMKKEHAAAIEIAQKRARA